VHLLHGLSLVYWICCHSAGIEVGHAKVEAIHGWPIPKNLSQVDRVDVPDLSVSGDTLDLWK
jgi:hypothetical protein